VGTDILTVTVVGKTDTSLVYTGDTSGQYSDSIELSAILTETETGTPIVGETIEFTLGTQTVTAVTDGDGIATVSLTITQGAGTYSVDAEYAGNSQYESASDSQAFTIVKENAIVDYIGDGVVCANNYATFKAQLTEIDDGSPGDVSGKTIVFELTTTDGTLLKTITAVTDASGVATSDPVLMDVSSQLYDIVTYVEENPYYSVEEDRSVFVVYDPCAGFVIGFGCIRPGSSNSEPGDSLPGMTGCHKAIFGFYVKYVNGESTPRGRLCFHYCRGDFHLRSSSMDWLVIMEDDLAKFQGHATIRGMSGTYTFRVDVHDGSFWCGGNPGRFILKVWAPGADPDEDSPVYQASGNVWGLAEVITY
jgi:hypothetical protein